MWQWLMGLEAEKFDLSEKLKRQKYDVSHRSQKEFIFLTQSTMMTMSPLTQQDDLPHL